MRRFNKNDIWFIWLLLFEEDLVLSFYSKKPTWYVILWKVRVPLILSNSQCPKACIPPIKSRWVCNNAYKMFLHSHTLCSSLLRNIFIHVRANKDFIQWLTLWTSSNQSSLHYRQFLASQTKWNWTLLPERVITGLEIETGYAQHTTYDIMICIGP